MSAGASCRVLAVMALLATVTARAQAQATDLQFQEQVRVERVVIDAYVTDYSMDAIPGLTTSDFKLTVDGQPVPIESVEWVRGDRAELEPIVAGAAGSAEAVVPRGRLLLLLFQVERSEPSRLLGGRRASLAAKKSVRSLLPTDRAAVLSFDTHLKLWQDFTGDSARLGAAIERAFQGEAEPARVEPARNGPSLVRGFDFDAARKAVTPEAAMGIAAKAAAPILGAKAMVLFGWGLQTIGGISGPNPKDRRDEMEAWPYLEASRMTVFVLDVTDAESHLGEIKMQTFAAASGGSYEKTNVFAGAPFERILKATSGRYIVVFRKPDLPRGRHMVHLEVSRRNIRVMARPEYVDR
jgi:VWFA-related protein